MATWGRGSRSSYPAVLKEAGFVAAARKCVTVTNKVTNIVCRCRVSRNRNGTTGGKSDNRLVSKSRGNRGKQEQQ